MTDSAAREFSPPQRLAAWSVHLFTASGAVFGLLTLNAINNRSYITAFWFMCMTIIIDSCDGMLARRAMTTKAAPQIDGALLDNIVDYLNYVITPAFFMVESDLLPYGLRFIGAGLVVLASAYQFTQPGAKTEDHFFKGFPSYWNIVVFYLFIWQKPPIINFLVIVFLALMIFVPIKYVYPSRMTYLSPKRWIRRSMLVASLIWAFSTTVLLWIHPRQSRFFMTVSIGYVALYVGMSLLKTFDRNGRILGRTDPPKATGEVSACHDDYA